MNALRRTLIEVGYAIALGFLLALVLGSVLANPTQLPPPDVVCDKGWCRIRYDTLKALVEGAQKLQEHNAYIETLCNWRQKP